MLLPIYNFGIESQYDITLAQIQVHECYIPHFEGIFFMFLKDKILALKRIKIKGNTTTNVCFLGLQNYLIDLEIFIFRTQYSKTVESGTNQSYVSLRQYVYLEYEYSSSCHNPRTPWNRKIDHYRCHGITNNIQMEKAISW